MSWKTVRGATNAILSNEFTIVLVFKNLSTAAIDAVAAGDTTKGLNENGLREDEVTKAKENYFGKAHWDSNEVPN